MVEMNVVLNVSSAYLNSTQVLPTPLSPISSNLNRRSYAFFGTTCWPPPMLAIFLFSLILSTNSQSVDTLNLQRLRPQLNNVVLFLFQVCATGMDRKQHFPPRMRTKVKLESAQRPRLAPLVIMGAYLDTPVTTKESSHGVCNVGNREVTYASTAVQGWRVHMEVDVHVYNTCM